jgi:hypothetical protein
VAQLRLLPRVSFNQAAIHQVVQRTVRYLSNSEPAFRPRLCCSVVTAQPRCETDPTGSVSVSLAAKKAGVEKPTTSVDHSPRSPVE